MFIVVRSAPVPPRSTAIARPQDGRCLEAFVAGDRELRENQDLSGSELMIERVFDNLLQIRILLVGRVHNVIHDVERWRSTSAAPSPRSRLDHP